MNRSLGSITAAILVVLLAGCGQKSAPPVAGSAPSAGPTAPVTASPSGGNIYGPGGTPPASGPTGTGKDAPVLPPVIKEGSGGWCSVGESYDDGRQQYKINGLVQFKGKTFCQAVMKSDAGTITVYFLEDESDGWMVMTVNGQTQEIHLADN